MPKENITAPDPLKGGLVSYKEVKLKWTSALTAGYICQRSLVKGIYHIWDTDEFTFSKGAQVLLAQTLGP